MTVPGTGRVRVWVRAARPPTLTAAIAPVLVGNALAIRDDVFSLATAAVAMFGAIAIQIGANFANDAADFRRGADTAHRIGEPRMTQQGLLTERQVMTAMWAVFALAALAGAYLTVVAGWPVLAIGAASIMAAIAYTAGPWPYGYRAMGEVFTFVFFGVVAVSGTYFVQAEQFTLAALAALAVAVPVGCTVSAIILVNNIRDIETDRRAGKITLAVLLGRSGARRLYLALLLVAYLSVAALWAAGDFEAWVLLSWLSLPLAVSPVRAVLRRVDGPPLNAALRATARLHLALAALLSVGITL